MIFRPAQFFSINDTVTQLTNSNIHLFADHTRYSANIFAHWQLINKFLLLKNKYHDCSIKVKHIFTLIHTLTILDEEDSLKTHLFYQAVQGSVTIRPAVAVAGMDSKRTGNTAFSSC